MLQEWNETGERVQKHSSKYENLVHDKDGILNLWGKIKYSICIEIVGQAFGTPNESSASLLKPK